MLKTISKDQLLQAIQEFAAIEAVGTSAVRGQPAKTKKVIQKVLMAADLNAIPRRSQPKFEKWRNQLTECVQRKLPNPDKPWGIARKAVNLFLRDCFYNHYLREEYGLAAVEQWLEVPLDGVVSRAFCREAGRGELPRWRGLGRVTPGDSVRFQEFAKWLAGRVGLQARIFLDNVVWLRNRTSQ